MKVNLVVAPYRDSYFRGRFGSAVRDLQFIDTLEQDSCIAAITVINRPVALAERLLLRKTRTPKYESNKVFVHDVTSSDVLRPLKGRSWAADVYPFVLKSILTSVYRTDMFNVFLDFLPIGRAQTESLEGWHYWYDFIDNFAKHNRFSEHERELVREKYSFIKEHANSVTAVSDACIQSLGQVKATHVDVISNKIFQLADGEGGAGQRFARRFDLGFMGFITDKLDVEFISKVSERFSVAIYGKCLDRKIGSRLRSLKNVSMMGEFKYTDVPAICRSFSVGMIPYLSARSHDGSPLKLYEYIKYNRPCVTSMDYEVSNKEYILNYNSENFEFDSLKELILLADDPAISASIARDWMLEDCLKKFVRKIVPSSVRAEDARVDL